MKICSLPNCDPKIEPNPTVKGTTFQIEGPPLTLQLIQGVKNDERWCHKSCRRPWSSRSMRNNFDGCWSSVFGVEWHALHTHLPKQLSQLSINSKMIYSSPMSHKLMSKQTKRDSHHTRTCTHTPVTCSDLIANWPTNDTIKDQLASSLHLHHKSFYLKKWSFLYIY